MWRIVADGGVKIAACRLSSSCPRHERLDTICALDPRDAFRLNSD
jgi:hypothetical protein